MPDRISRHRRLRAVALAVAREHKREGDEFRTYNWVQIARYWHSLVLKG